MRPSLIPISIRVGSGRDAPIDSNTFLNCGMIHHKANMTAITPKMSTTTGYERALLILPFMESTRS